MKIKKFQRSKKIIFRDIEGTIYILDPINSAFRTLNETASYIWKFIEKPKSFEEIRDQIMTQFSVDKKTCEKDLRTFIENYAKLKYINEKYS